jgi:hypothetical protein
VNELVPIVGGLVVGLLLRAVPRRARPVVGPLAVLAVGALATVVSREYEVGWEYLLVDIPLTALTTTAGHIVAPYLGPPSLRDRRPSGS